LTPLETYAILALRSKRSDPLQGSGDLLGLLSKFFCPQTAVLERLSQFSQPGGSDLKKVEIKG
jgi:hypothetical protein